VNARGPKTIALLLAGGEGLRSGGRKQFRRVGGRSLLRHALDGLFAAREVGGVIVVVPADTVAAVERDLSASAPRGWWKVTAGGATRHLSSRAGLAQLPDACEWVLVHDAARPFASPELVRRVLRATKSVGAAVPAVAVADSTLEIDAQGHLRRYLPRERLRAVQTPQGFAREVIESAFASTRRTDFTDDASAVRRAGHEVAVVEGEAENRKITTGEDLRVAARELARRVGEGS
jgi:2-C-methyl-D-erythritol 4-phosphate cytidylyltransferase